jgi:hypothetical protein
MKIINLENKHIVRKDGTIMRNDFGDGKMIASLILTSKDNDDSLLELIAVHPKTISGDVKTTWGYSSIFSKSKLYLKIEFLQPQKLTISIEFILKKHHVVIDAIIQSRGLILAYRKANDTKELITGIDGTITIEVSESGFDKKWETILFDTIKKIMRKNKVHKKQVKKRTNEKIKQIRELLHITTNI